jgi:hypothetical protein
MFYAYTILSQLNPVRISARRFGTIHMVSLSQLSLGFPDIIIPAGLTTKTPIFPQYNQQDAPVIWNYLFL